MTQENKVLLNAKQFEELAKKQSNILNDLQLIENLIYYMPESGNHKVDEQLNLIHAKIQDMVTELDRSTFILYNTTDEKELEAFGAKVEGGNQVLSIENTK